MELRSKTKQREHEEYEELKLTLRGMGFFEEQMELQEMQDIMQALQMSEPSVSEKNNNSHPLFHSTMIDSYGQSPEPECVNRVVEVLVHHPMDWSPPGNDSLSESINVRKRITDQINNDTAKRLRYDSIENFDSGVNLSSSTTPNFSPQKVNLIDSSKYDDPLNIDSGTSAEIGNGMFLQYNSSYANTEAELFYPDDDPLIACNTGETIKLPSLFEPQANNLQGQANTKTMGYHDESESWD